MVTGRYGLAWSAVSHGSQSSTICLILQCNPRYRELPLPSPVLQTINL